MRRRRLRTSRLSRTSEKQNRRQTLYFTIGIIAIFVVLLQFGPSLINIFGNAIYNLRGAKDENNQVISSALLQPPILNGIPDATQSAYISFNGSVSDTDGVVEIYVNDDLKKEIDIVDKKEFEIKILTISEGNNTIKARFVKNNKTSSFTNDFSVNFFKEKPKLEVSFPGDGATFTKADKNITITGQTDPDTLISVNGFRAIVAPDGKFSYVLSLSDGDNNITVFAQNPAGASTQKDIEVKYNP